MSETLEHTARRIADHGREALLARLRPAFEEAAAAHKDALSLDDEQLEQMVQRAADRADGLQWRRALASVATEQLGIGLGEALGHPAVARAQAIVGAPSYEEALSALGAQPPAPRPEQQPEPAPEEQQPAAMEEADEAEEAEHEDADAEDAAEHEDADAEDAAEHEDADADAEEDDEYEDDEYEDDEEEHELSAPVPAAGPADHADDDSEKDGDGVRLRAIHLGGIANLSPAEGDLELLISSAGLDIIRGPEHSVLGRLTWDEIVALETPEIGGRFRRKRQTDAHLVVRSEQGSASFEIPGVTSDELRKHIDPLLARR